MGGNEATLPPHHLLLPPPPPPPPPPPHTHTHTPPPLPLPSQLPPPLSQLPLPPPSSSSLPTPSNNNQVDPGVVRWVRSNPRSYQRTYRMALLYFQALACSGDEQLSNTLRKTYVAVTVRSTVVPGTKFTASKLRGWSWLKPNGLGTRPRSSIFTCT